MRILGIDWGEKRTGLAVAAGGLAEPYGVVSTFAGLIKVARQEGIERVVLGIPEGKHEKKTRDLGRRIEAELGIPVVERSEVLTSRQALERMIEAGRSKKNRRELDAAAAALLLQEYLDSDLLS